MVLKSLYQFSSDTETFKRQFPTNNSMVYHFHPIAFVEHMKLITTPKYEPDHGEIHDPIVNPQVRGWYNKATYNNKDSKIGGWNPYASLFILKDKDANTNVKILM
ncbi:hypothetical protein [Aquimarina aquimarini]|uniref:hypothetical protein n=2 Tax=Aquimarina aquimarini TaxID=1191734 RepID=UPI00131F0C35|nr:hypothetical protein [Aquimarina aquimarini]